ncbi:hypothetical protein E2C01_080186 [Portunus trituberculatus]|uniref:Uncharacterized protein n=1 Tax=Portunus trituberculatus TaxID=210409 RepID=A0A5B7IYW4_PORTR|nr:hypothetical protein [Portunus trituberculatus]
MLSAFFLSLLSFPIPHHHHHHYHHHLFLYLSYLSFPQNTNKIKLNLNEILRTPPPPPPPFFYFYHFQVRFKKFEGPKQNGHDAPPPLSGTHQDHSKNSKPSHPTLLPTVQSLQAYRNHSKDTLFEITLY